MNFTLLKALGMLLLLKLLLINVKALKDANDKDIAKLNYAIMLPISFK